MSETQTKPVPTRDEIETAVRDYLRADEAEKRLHDLLESLPCRYVIAYLNGESLLIEPEYSGDRVRIRRNVMDLGPLEL